MRPVFRTFLSKSGSLHVLKALRDQGFFFLPLSFDRFKAPKMQNEYFYVRTLFEHSFFTKQPSRFLQTPAESCISRSSEDEAHCKIEYNAPRFCGSFVLRCTLCGTPPFFEGSKKYFGRRVVMWLCRSGKRLLHAALLQKLVNAAEVYCFPRSL